MVTLIAAWILAAAGERESNLTWWNVVPKYPQ